jgi:hypothetical protein
MGRGQLENRKMNSLPSVKPFKEYLVIEQKEIIRESLTFDPELRKIFDTVANCIDMFSKTSDSGKIIINTGLSNGVRIYTVGLSIKKPAKRK